MLKSLVLSPVIPQWARQHGINEGNVDLLIETAKLPLIERKGNALHKAKNFEDACCVLNALDYVVDASGNINV